MSSDSQDLSASLTHALENSPQQPILGTVLAVQANYYQVRLDRGDHKSDQNNAQNWLRSRQQSVLSCGSPDLITPGLQLLCTRRSRLKKLGQQVMVGDRVEIEQPDWQGGRGAIAGILPRHSELDRPPVANANQILLVFALAEPSLDPHQLSHFLVKAESTGLQVCLCLSKSDLVPEPEQVQWRQRLAAWGYQPVFISVYAAIGLPQLLQHLGQQMTVVSGPSGVGKSSLINYWIPLANLRVGEVSGKLARGRHTTRHVELFELPSGGLLADTPGFNQPELNCAPEELANYFPEIQQRLVHATCQFSDCLHRDEPGCKVRGGWERYDHYLLLVEAAIARQQILGQAGGTESNLKRKSRRQGRQDYEPKLDTKKYRQPSRRSQQREVQCLQREEELSMDSE